MNEEVAKDEGTRVKVLLEALQIPDNVVLCIYQYGSRVCGTATPGKSDWDFMLVLEDGYDIPFERAVANIDTNNYSVSHFVKAIAEHDMLALIGLFLPPQNVWRKNRDFTSTFVCNLEKLRVGVSTISHQAFAYASICHREGHYRKAKKNLVHSVRYLLYGIQLAKHGKITDYSVANSYYFELLGKENESENEKARKMGDEGNDGWEALRKKYKKLNKQLHGEFAALLPKKKKGEGAILRQQRRVMNRRAKMGRTNDCVPKGEAGEAYIAALVEKCKEEDGIVTLDSQIASNTILYYLTTTKNSNL